MLPQHLSAGLLSFVRFADYKTDLLCKTPADESRRGETNGGVRGGGD